MTGTITGWRGWAVDGDPPLLVSPLTGFNPWLPGDLTAECNAIPADQVTEPEHFNHVRHEPHAPVPDPECSCGYRVLELNRLVHWLRTVTNSPFRPPSQRPFVPDCIGGAQIWGRTCGGDPSDPRQAMRGEFARVTGPLFICQANADDGAALAAYYGTDVIAADTDKRTWINGRCWDDFRAYREDPAALGSRLTRALAEVKTSAGSPPAAAQKGTTA